MKVLRCLASGAPRGDVYSRQNFHQRLASSFQILRRPAASNITYSSAVRDFTQMAILGYECGLTEDSFRQYLLNSPVCFDRKECLEMVCLVWITLMLSYKARVRWSTTEAVSEETLKRARGFTELMVIAYFEKGMTWISLEKLQLEQIAMMGKAEAADIVAEKARIVFTTLETVAPQFPSL